jgi:hypothetical protein
MLTNYLLTLYLLLIPVVISTFFRARISISSYSYQGNIMTLTYNGLTHTNFYMTLSTDINGHFKGCSFNVSSSDFPCLLYDNINLKCLNRSTGFILSNGRCYDIPCRIGQYKRYGLCYSNPVGCEFYNEFTKCTKCSSTYKLNNNVCERIPLICSGRTFYNPSTYQCILVDSKCNNFDPKTG